MLSTFNCKAIVGICEALEGQEVALQLRNLFWQHKGRRPPLSRSAHHEAQGYIVLSTL